MTETNGTRQPLTRTEQITALSHYYRAEVQRSLAWRERLDRTTNWAVGATAAFLGFGFSHPEINHTLFLFGLAIIYVLLFVESRRFRYYDAYEYRIRLLNHHFIYGVLVERSIPEEFGFDETTYWRAELASDLRYPQYKMSRSTALGRRIYANYGYLFAILIVGWLFKIGEKTFRQTREAVPVEPSQIDRRGVAHGPARALDRSMDLYYLFVIRALMGVLHGYPLIIDVRKNDRPLLSANMPASGF